MKRSVILCNSVRLWWCLYLSWLFLGALRVAGEGAGVVGGALANLDLVVNVVALNGEGHGGTLGHTLKHNSIFTRPFDSQIPTLTCQIQAQGGITAKGGKKWKTRVE